MLVSSNSQPAVLTFPASPPSAAALPAAPVLPTKEEKRKEKNRRRQKQKVLAPLFNGCVALDKFTDLFTEQILTEHLESLNFSFLICKMEVKNKGKPRAS